MRPRTLWVLLVLVAGLAAFVWFVERDLPGSDERAEQAKRVLPLEIDEVSRIAWSRDGEKVVLARSDGESRSWRLVEPLSGRADEARVDRVLDELASLEKRRTLESGEPAQLGLDPPRAVLTVDTEGGELRLAIGGAVPASDSMIVAAGEGPPFYVVAGGLWTELERPAGEWRSTAAFPGESGDVARLALDAGGQRVVIARRGGDYWLESPLVDRADGGTVSRFLSALTGLEVDEFLDGATGLEEYGLAPPSAVLEATLDDGSSWTLELGASADAEADGGVYARLEGAVIRVSDRLREDLTRAPEAWRSLEWATLEVYEIDALDVHDSEGSLSFARAAGQWERDGEQVDFNVVSDLLYAITGSKAEALDADQAIVGEPILSVTLNPGEGAQLLEIFAPRADRFPASTSDRETSLWLGGDRVRDILSRLSEARTAETLEPPSVDDGEASGEPDDTPSE